MSRKITNREYLKADVPGHYFRSLTIQNLRCFGRKQTLELADKTGRPYRWTILLGENGVGKTSLLKSIVAVAPSPKLLFGDVQKLGLYPALLDWQRQWDTRRMDTTLATELKARVVAGHSLGKVNKDSELLLSVSQAHNRGGEITASDDSYSQLGDFLCFAYGASRRMGRASLTDDKYSTASVSLFDDEAPLINVEEFFMQADYEAKTAKSSAARQRRERIKALLLEILPDVRDIRIGKSRRSGRQVEVNTSFGWVRLGELSLGYKSLIAWVVDFASRMYHYHQIKPKPFDEPAVVLIDEIDLHMHPAWQRKIIHHLSRTFPNTQFIASAHSPLIVQAAANANLVLLKRRGSQVLVENATETVKNWRIDQILTSDIFGLKSGRGIETEKLLARRRKLLKQPTMTKAVEQQIEKLDEKIGPIPVAETPEYISAMQIIEKAAGKAS